MGMLATTNRIFSLFNILVDVTMGREALVVTTTLIRLVSSKMEKSILHVTGWVNGHIEIFVARL